MRTNKIFKNKTVKLIPLETKKKKWQQSLQSYSLVKACYLSISQIRKKEKEMKTKNYNG